MPRPAGAKNKKKFTIPVSDMISMSEEDLIRSLLGEVVNNARLDREKSLTTYRDLCNDAEKNNNDSMVIQVASHFLKLAQDSNKQLIDIYKSNKEKAKSEKEVEDDTDFYAQIEGCSEDDDDVEENEQQ